MNWLKEFHASVQKYDRVDNRIFLLVGALLVGLAIGLDMSYTESLTKGLLGILNIYFGLTVQTRKS